MFTIATLLGPRICATSNAVPWLTILLPTEKDRNETPDGSIWLKPAQDACDCFSETPGRRSAALCRHQSRCETRTTKVTTAMAINLAPANKAMTDAIVSI